MLCAMHRRDFVRLAGAATAFAAWPVNVQGAGPITIAATGDCILTRRVSQITDPAFVEMVRLLRGADCTYGNCELVMADEEPGFPTAAGSSLSVVASPRIADEFAWLGFDIMGTANNHSTDYGVEGIRTTRASFDRVGIAHAGTGLNLQEAAAPAYADTPAGRVALINCASTFQPWSPAVAARGDFKGVPGLSAIRLERRYQLDAAAYAALGTAARSLARIVPVAPAGNGPLKWLGNTFVPGASSDVLSDAAAADVKRVTDAIAVARRNARIVLVSIHAHETYGNLDTPDKFLQPFARACIDAGADAFLGAGPHVTWGVELYKRRPICYSLGDFFFQYETVRGYAADTYEAYGLDAQTLDHSRASDAIPLPKDRTLWESVVPMMTFTDDGLQHMRLHPVASDMNQPRHSRGTPLVATGETAERIVSRVADLSKPFGTSIDFDGRLGLLRL
jgi:poly-gamma-glutamate capsule biosynthesis protein CapA/YwtB (metallophosphatase superfamily)